MPFKKLLKNLHAFLITDFWAWISLRTSPLQNTEPKEIAADLVLGLASQPVRLNENYKKINIMYYLNDIHSYVLVY